MKTLTSDDLYSLEDYARVRDEFRSKVMAHKKLRRVPVGAHATLLFEDRLTMHYQIQEMLRAERIFEVGGVREELDAYNALIPDGRNWKATMMIEYEDIHERRDALTRLRGVEQSVWVEVDGFDRIKAIADEDLERDNEDKTSAVHFLRFELAPEAVEAAKSGAAVTVGIAHSDYTYETRLSAGVREALARDLN